MSPTKATQVVGGGDVSRWDTHSTQTSHISGVVNDTMSERACSLIY